MKTRKVGKIVSLLVAIVLVATIMIPAASVLADSASQKYPNANWTEVSSFSELKTALDSAETDGSKTYIKLKGNIDMPKGATFVPGSDKGIFVGEVLKLDSLRSVSWTKSSKEHWNAGAAKREYRWEASISDKFSTDEAIDILNASPLAHVSKTNPYNEGDTSANFYAAITATNLNYWEDIFAFAEGKYKNTTGKADSDAREYPSYFDTNLIVWPETDVVIDLNGKTIDGGQSDKAYTNSPTYIQSIFIVKGALTVEDFVGGGKLTGATGYLAAGTYGSISETQFTGLEPSTSSLSNTIKNRHRFVDSSWRYTENTTHDSNAPGNIWDSKYNASSASAWKLSSIENYGSGQSQPRYAYWIKSGSVTEVRGGAVYVSDGGSFTLNGGSITRNTAWMGGDYSIINTSVNATAKGGGVYVEAGGTFNMTGGEISNNASRAYQTNTSAAAATKDAYAYGGGVYLEGTQGTVEGAVMTMTGGKIAENALYAEVGSNGSSQRSARAYGGGIYVGIGATCTIMGDDVEEGETDLEMVKSFPQVTNNSIGALAKYSDKSNPDITIQGGGIYNGGTLNLKNALITANDFAEGDVDIPGNKKSALGLNTATRVMRDPDTGLARYILEYNADGKAKTYVTRLDDRFSENLELATEKVAHATSGVYGTMHGNEEMVIFSDGAGVCVREDAKLVVGERVWITDNYDLVTTGHKAFTSVRDYTRTWEQEKQITDDRVMTTNDDGYGVSYTDPAGGYVYDGTYVAPKSATMSDGTTTYTSHVMDGYAFSDTTDDVYIPEGNVIYKGGSLFETKIGVNYWNMVNADGKVEDGGYGQAGNRVIVKAGKNLDPEIWGTDSSIPTQSDIQFFYLNDNNKNWERVGSRTRNANNDYYDYPKTDKNVPVYGYKLPNYIIQYPSWDAGKTTPCELCDPELTTSYDNRSRAACIDVSSVTDEMKQTSPYEGYINYDYSYPSKRWVYFTKISSDAGFTNRTYDQPTYRISDPDKDPQHDKTMTEFTNSIVNFPQRAYPVTSTMKSGLDNLANGGLPKSYLKAKYMDYKVVYDNDQFGKTEPVLRFGTYKDAQSKDTIRKMFVTVNFDEAGTHYYGKSTKTVVFSKDTAGTSANTDSFVTADTAFSNIAAESTFYGANKTKGTINIAKIVPNYAAYGKSDELTARGTEKIETENGKTRPLTSISTETDGSEQTDLYFKGWRYYTSYGDGPETVTLNNSDAETSLGNNLTYRGYYTVKLENLFNPNINSQPCPSLTATWYTEEELKEARTRISNVRYQQVIKSNGSKALRVIALAGSDLAKYDSVGFVISTTNATPTIEGGYQYTASDKTYKKIGVNIGGQKYYYDADILLGGSYYSDREAVYKGCPLVTDEAAGARWTFSNGTNQNEFSAKVTDAANGYKYAGIFYTDILVDGMEDVVFFVTPYAEININGESVYYYGESRAVCYNG